MRQFKFFSSNSLYILLATIFYALIIIIACAWCCASKECEFNPDNNRTVMINHSKI